MLVYDLIIIGGGPAGLSAGIYGARAKRKTLILEKAVVGGQAYTTREIVNYPGFCNQISGPELTGSMAEHAKKFGVEIVKDEAIAVDLNNDIKIINTKNGSQYQARTVILAVGAHPRLLNIPGEKEFKGMGVSYCATCDAEFYDDLDVIVVGNGDAAIEEAMYITKFARKVYVIVIHDEGIVDCNKISAEKAFKNKKIEFVWNSVLTEIKGNGEVESAVVKNLKTDINTELNVSGVFIYVGMNPGTEFLKGQIDLDDKGYIITNKYMETSASGVFAAGDGIQKTLRQVVTAANDGAVAAVSADNFLTEEEDFTGNILKSNQPVLLAFWNPGIEGNIDKLALIEKLLSGQGDEVKYMKIDVSRKNRIARKFNVVDVPSLLLLKDSKVIRTILVNDKRVIAEFLDEYARGKCNES